MNSPEQVLIWKKQSDKRMFLSAGLLLAMVNGIVILSAHAQADGQDSFLPPEIVPTSTNSNYTPAPSATVAPVMNGSTNNNLSANQASYTQAAENARQSAYNSMMGTGGQAPAFNQSNMPSNMAGGQFSSQGLSSSSNNTANAVPPQSQTLSGSVSNNPQTQQRTSGGVSKLAGLAVGAGMSGYAAAGIRSPGGIYSAGLLGASLLNYGLRNAFKF
jgi:hypothetical protein